MLKYVFFTWDHPLWHSLIGDAFWLLVGACVGSFLNVCIDRLPLTRSRNSSQSPEIAGLEPHLQSGTLSLSSPRRSLCFGCGRQLKWWENLPVLSYLILRGKCRGCGASIGMRVPLVEAGMALLTWLLFLRFEVSPAFLILWVTSGTVVVLSVTLLNRQPLNPGLKGWILLVAGMNLIWLGHF